MRQLLIASELFAPGGVQYVGREALAALSQDGRSLEVWSLRDRSVPAGFSRRGATIRCAAGSRSLLAKWALGSALASCRDLSTTVMHAHLAPIALPLKARGASLSVMLHGVEVWRRLTAAERVAVRRADRLIANSRHTADRFREANTDFDEARIDICPLGIPPADGAAGEPADGRVALIVSRLSAEDRYKGHDALLAAWSSVRARVPDARLVIAGDGDDRSRLEAAAASMGVADAVQFVGRVSDVELERWYRRCAFFVLPSTNEGFGLVFLEAMRAGKACIACAGAPREIIEHEATGLILPDQEAATVADAVVRLFVDAPLRERLGRQAQARWRDAFTSTRFAERFRALTQFAPERAA